MKRKPTAYKIARLLLFVLIVSLLPVSVWAQETTLTTNVPATHTLHLELSGNGTVTVDGVPYEKSVSIQINRHSTPSISIAPDSGWKIKSVFLDGQDVTKEIKNGAFSFPEMCSDMELTVIFEATSTSPQTGDNSNIGMIWIIMLLSVIGMILCVIAQRKVRKNNM